MAKRKAAKRKKSSRRVSGMNLSKKGNLIYVAAIAAGFLLGNKVNELIDKVSGSLDPKIVAMIQAGVGFALPTWLLKNMAGKIIGGLLLGSGLKRGLKAFNIISGFRDMRVIAGNEQIAGRGRKVGYPLPMTSVYRQSAMSVVNGVGNMKVGNHCGSGAAAAY